jgi:hypothetical protein
MLKPAIDHGGLGTSRPTCAGCSHIQCKVERAVLSPPSSKPMTFEPRVAHLRSRKFLHLQSDHTLLAITELWNESTPWRPGHVRRRRRSIFGNDALALCPIMSGGTCRIYDRCWRTPQPSCYGSFIFQPQNRSRRLRSRACNGCPIGQLPELLSLRNPLSAPEFVTAIREILWRDKTRSEFGDSSW